MHLRLAIWIISIVFLLLGSTGWAGAEESGLAARWGFDEGKGAVLNDSSGHSNNGNIHGAQWVKSGKGHALRFDGVDDYVDCGNDPSLDITGPLTLETWVHPTAPATAEPGVVGKFFESYALTYYKTGSCYFYISGGGNGVSGDVRVGQWSHLACVFDGASLRFYLNGQEIASGKSKFDKVKSGKNFLMGCVVGDPGHTDEALRATAYFAGMIDGVRVYSRPLSWREIVDHYNVEATAKGQKMFDASVFGKLLVRPFLYPNTSRAVLEVNYKWVQPLPAGATLRAELIRAGQTESLETVALKPDSPRDLVEAPFSLAAREDGDYVLRATVLNANGQPQQTAEQKFRWPAAPPPLVPSPSLQTVPILPSAPKPPSYRVKQASGGGFVVEVKGHSFPVESTYSYPHGGENALGVTPAKGSEPEWKVMASQGGKQTYRVQAAGKYYSLRRVLRLNATRIEVEDTITNKTDDVLGIILSNHINTRGTKDARCTLSPNPSVFVAQGDTGLGLIALDDLYQVQQQTQNSDGLVSIRDEHFGLDKGASYTIQWALYPTATNDYFDFINQYRKDENINGRVEGGLELTGRWKPPTIQEAKLKAIKYVHVSALSRVMQNPTISLEGWEWMEYPQVIQRLKEVISNTTKMYPSMKVIFHVAHALYATNKPKELFSDSLAIDVNGNMDHYGPNTMDYYGQYFSKELVDAGWRWWLFYPTMENSFGKYMLKAADYMVNELGATGIWADGFVGGYVRNGYTYDRWDGHSVIIDPNTKLVTRKVSNVTYVSLPVLKAVADKFKEKGGVVITNGDPGPRSFCKLENLITSCETAGGDQHPVAALYVAPTVTPLGNPLAIKSQRDIYRDILTKLDLGALYFWYGEQDYVKEPMIVSHMYPITFESLHAGTVRGKERIVTKNSGVYGWPGDRSLHVVYRYDARGSLVDNRFFTTVDATSVRTDVSLKEGESAVVEKIPVTLKATSPVNVRVTRYDAGGLTMSLHGKGEATVVVSDGRFIMKPHANYRIKQREETTVGVNEQGILSTRIVLDGETKIHIERS